jgi:hypothetical protein
VTDRNRGLRALIPTAHARSAGDDTMYLPRITAGDQAPAAPACAGERQDHAQPGPAAPVVPLGAGHRRREPAGPVELDRAVATSAAAVLADLASGQSTAHMQRLADTLSDLLYAAAGTDTRRHAARTS